MSVKTPVKKEKRKIVPILVEQSPAKPLVQVKAKKEQKIIKSSKIASPKKGEKKLGNIEKAIQLEEKIKKQSKDSYVKFREGLNDKDYIENLRKRAIEKGYEKPSKKKVQGPSKAEIKMTAHGEHHVNMGDILNYIVEYSKLKAWGGKKNRTTLYDHLKKQLSDNKYYSQATHRFRKL